jgi:hypothetical protein
MRALRESAPYNTLHATEELWFDHVILSHPTRLLFALFTFPPEIPQNTIDMLTQTSGESET